MFYPIFQKDRQTYVYRTFLTDTWDTHVLGISVTEKENAQIIERQIRCKTFQNACNYPSVFCRSTMVGTYLYNIVMTNKTYKHRHTNIIMSALPTPPVTQQGAPAKEMLFCPSFPQQRQKKKVLKSEENWC